MTPAPIKDWFVRILLLPRKNRRAAYNLCSMMCGLCMVSLFSSIEWKTGAVLQVVSFIVFVLSSQVLAVLLFSAWARFAKALGRG